MRIPPLHLVTDDAILADPGFVRRATAVLEAAPGKIALHLRGPGSGGRMLHDRAAALLDAARGAANLLFVNDRVDVALGAGVDGVQLGRRSLPATEVRRLPGGARLQVGASVHSREELRSVSEGGGVDFLLFGWVYPTPSHPGAPGKGIPALREVLEEAKLPVVAIGGIREDRIGEVWGSGVQGIALRGAVWEHPDPAEAVRTLALRIGGQSQRIGGSGGVE